MKNWLSENRGLLFLFLVVVIWGVATIIITRIAMLESADLEAQLVEQQENYELTIEIAYATVTAVEDKFKKQERLLKQQELYAEQLEDYNEVLEERLIQAKEDVKGVYTEEDIQYIIDVFATYLVEYPPNGSLCVYENGTLFVFKMVNDNLILDEILSYNDLKELWLNK